MVVELVFVETVELPNSDIKRSVVGIWIYVIVRLLLMYQELGPQK